jgi:O-antigen ligase
VTTLPAGEFLLPAVAAERSAPRERDAVRLFRWLLAIYTALVITKIHELVPGLNHIQPAKIVGALLLLNALIVLRSRATVAVLRTVPAACAGLILVLAILSAPGGLWPRNSFIFLATVYWKTLLFFVIAATAWCDRATLRRSVVMLVVCQAIVAAALLGGVAQAMGTRAYVGASLDPNESALQLLVVIPLALYVATSGGTWKLLGIGCALLLIAGVAKTGSRGGFVGLVVVAGWMLVQVRSHRRRLQAMIAVAAGAAVVALTASDATKERFSSLLHPTEDYNYTYREGRVDVWRRGLGYMVRRPLLGVGVANFPIAEGVLSGKENEGQGIKYSAAHNIFIEVGGEIGVLGLIAFIRMLWMAAVGSRRVRRLGRLLWARGDPVAKREATLAEAALGSWVALLIGGFFLSVAFHPITYFVVALCIAVRLGSPLRQQAASTAPLTPQTGTA